MTEEIVRKAVLAEREAIKKEAERWRDQNKKGAVRHPLAGAETPDMSAELHGAEMEMNAFAAWIGERALP